MKISLALIDLGRRVVRVSLGADIVVDGGDGFGIAPLHHDI